MWFLSRNLLIIILVIISVVDCQKWNSGNRSSSSSNRQSSRSAGYYAGEDGNGKDTETNTPAKLQQNKTSRSGVGAWGYIAIALTVILSGLGVYYFVIFYPILCKKERMYDVMEMTSV